jgi:nickel-dependent lactate racemase
LRLKICKTFRGTPVHINKYVAQTYLRILTGLIKPHAVAGYTGGGKFILPGVSSIETVISDHNYKAAEKYRKLC